MIQAQNLDGVILVIVQGRLDAHGTKELDQQLHSLLQPADLCLVLDTAGVDYLSSAGLRTLLTVQKKLDQRGGNLAISGMQAYCRKVLDLAGFSRTFPLFDQQAEAIAFCRRILRERQFTEHWDALETIDLDCGQLRIIPGGTLPGAVEVLGDVRDVLHSRITPAHLCSKQFSETEFSIGLGGLGDRVDDYFPIMGEMMTIGGTMVWLPTDGNDTPDFLIPKADTGQVTLRTAFNGVIAGGFNEYLLFESRGADGTSVDTLYRALFRLAKQRRADYRGVLGIAMRAQMATLLGAGIKRSPIKDYAPANGEMINHPSNAAAWFASDSVPRHRDVTALICGIGADLTVDLGHYEQEELNSVFYLNPAATQSHSELLHNHAVVFSKLPWTEHPVNLEAEITQVVDQGDFLDMRHLLDRSTVQRAFFGINYIQSFRKDPRGYRGTEPA
jgi:anti-anti-sigma factor